MLHHLERHTLPASDAAEPAPAAPAAGKFDRLIRGDNLAVLAALLETHRGRVDLIYIDPPFAAGGQRVMAVEKTARNEAGRRPVREVTAYHDAWTSEDYVAMMRPRLALLRELLSDRGTIYVHCDQRANFLLRALLNEIFGAENFRNEIIWCYRGGGVPRNDFAAKHDTILRYTKSGDYYFNVEAVRAPYSDDVRSSAASRYDKSYRSNKVYGGYRPHERGKHPDDWWMIQPLMPSDKTERIGYPTQKPVELLQRIIDASSAPGDLVLDAFCGSGTTAAVAAGLRAERATAGGKPRLRYSLAAPRRWIAIDASDLAVHTTRKRMIDLLRRQSEACQAEGGFDLFAAAGVGEDSNGPQFTAIATQRNENDRMTADIRLTSFQPSNLGQTGGRIAASLDAPEDPFAALDHWAVEVTERGGGLFEPDWCDFRTAARASVVRDCAVRHEIDSTQVKIAVQVVDIFGRECRKLIALPPPH